MNGAATGSAQDDPRGFLRRHHDHLEQLFDELTRAFALGEREPMRQLWTRFETELQAHFEFEEKEVLPRLARVAPTEPAALLREHASIRAKVAALGVGLDLHLARADAVDALVLELKQHAEREDALLYRFIDASSDHGFAASIRRFAAALLPKIEGLGAAVPVPRTVVYIEDNPSSIAFMKDVLADFDRVELLTAPTAEIGVEIARARRPDVIIVDIPTTGTRALAAMKHLHEWPETREIAVIGLSFPACTEDSAGSVGVAVSRYLEKPVKVDELVQTLEMYLTPRPRAVTP